MLVDLKVIELLGFSYIILLPRLLIKPTFDVLLLGDAHKDIDEQVVEVYKRNVLLFTAGNSLLEYILPILAL